MASAPLHIDMADPSVRRLIEGDPGDGRIEDPTKRRREMVQLAGDERHGLESTHRLDTGKVEVLVSYRGRVGDFDMTVDVYQLPGEKPELHIICPKCRNKSRITAERKQIAFDPGATRPYTFVDGSRMPTNGGSLDVEPFECGWEMPDAGKHTPGLRSGGITLCRMRMGISSSVARDA